MTHRTQPLVHGDPTGDHTACGAVAPGARTRSSVPCPLAMRADAGPRRRPELPVADVDSAKAARAVTHDPKGVGAGHVCDRGTAQESGDSREDSTTRRKRSLSVVVRGGIQLRARHVLDVVEAIRREHEWILARDLDAHVADAMSRRAPHLDPIRDRGAVGYRFEQAFRLEQREQPCADVVRGVRVPARAAATASSWTATRAFGNASSRSSGHVPESMPPAWS